MPSGIHDRRLDTVSTKTPLQVSALASTLVTRADLDQAIEALRSHPDLSKSGVEEFDRLLANRLVETGHLTSYQAEQLLRGNRKLHLGLYRITDCIGQGGMGTVFKAEHALMARTVAVKVLPRSKSTPDAIASFSREIRAQAQLDHENLVRAYDAGHDGNVYFLVTEYVPGTDLRRYVRQRGPLNMAESATIISQAAKGLDHAHRRGLIHRDVKPGNLLVTPEGHTKVSDLGLAGSLNSAEEDPRAGKVVGTADYLSPEQILTPREVGVGSDIYSLGCTLYYAVTGKVPYPGGTTREKAKRHCEDMPINPRHFNPDLTDEFIEIIADMMEKDPKNRIQSAADVVRRLAKWARDAVPAGEARGSDASRAFFAKAHEPPVALPMHDTEPGFPEYFSSDPLQYESPSEVSQSTDPLAAAEQETLPLHRPHLAPIRSSRGWSSDPSLRFVLTPIAIILAVLAVLILLWTLG